MNVEESVNAFVQNMKKFCSPNDMLGVVLAQFVLQITLRHGKYYQNKSHYVIIFKLEAL